MHTIKTYTSNTLAKEIESAVEWLIKEDCGCSIIKLDDRLAVCVGWSAWFENDISCIHSKGEPEFCINAGIKVWTSDDMRTDFDWINAPYFKDGYVWDDTTSVRPNEDYEALAEYFLKEYEKLSKYDIQPDGAIDNVL